MKTRAFFAAIAAALAGIALCVLPYHRLAPVEAEPRIIEVWEDPGTEATDAPEEDNPLDPYEVELIGRTIWGEAEGVKDKAEQAAVAWCVLNRVDARGQTIEEVITAPHQYQGFYRVKGEVPEHFLQLAEDVLLRWRREKTGEEDVGRVLPKGYLFFIGKDGRNYFSTEWKSTDYWDWSIESPY